MTEFPSLGDYDGQFVHPRLAVGACPHPSHVPALVAAGIRGIVDARACMLKEHVIYIASLPETVFWTILGTWDGIYPNDGWTARSARAPARTTVCPLYLAFMVERTMQVVRDHSPALVHCGGGIGRSGHLAAVAYGALEGVTVDEAISRMREYRPVLADWNDDRYPGTDPADLVALARDILAETSSASRADACGGR